MADRPLKRSIIRHTSYDPLKVGGIEHIPGKLEQAMYSRDVSDLTVGAALVFCNRKADKYGMNYAVHICTEVEEVEGGLKLLHFHDADAGNFAIWDDEDLEFLLALKDHVRVVPAGQPIVLPLDTDEFFSQKGGE